MTVRKTTPAPARAKKTPAPKKAPARRRTPTRKHDGPQATPPTKAPAAPRKPEPSKAPKGFIIVDGSNVANSARVEGKPRLANIQTVHDLLVQEGYEPVVFVDASLRHQIPESEKKLFEQWEGNGFIVQVPRGVNGDEAVLEFASRRDAPVLSNDNYQDLESRYPWVRDRRRRIPYNLVRGELILYKYEDEPTPTAAPTAAVDTAPQITTVAVPVQTKTQRASRPAQPARVTPTTHAEPQPQRPRGRNQQVPRASPDEWNRLRETLLRLFDERVAPGESIRADQLSEETRRAIPGFRPNYYGSSSFTKLLDRMDDVFELARRGPNGQMASLEGSPRWPIVVLRRGEIEG